ncbi:MAG: BatA domain-containing protein [Granulosicoccus sp.]
MSLLFPAYFAGLLGLMLPWILHRFSDQNPPEQLFPSKQFLEATIPPVSRKRTLRYKVLLALRILSLLLLCLLFAQPWIDRDALPASQQQHHIVVIDQSLSMRAEGRWGAAIEKTNEIVSAVGDGSAELIAFDQQVRVLASTLASGTIAAAAFSNALDALQPGYSPGDYGLLMQRLDRIAAEQELPVKVWLISDMQLSGLPAQLNALYAPNVSELELIDVSIDDQLNVHLAAEASTTDGATASVSVSLLASTSANEPDANPIERTVLVESSSTVVAQRTIALTPGELHVMSFDDLVLPAESDPQFNVSLVESDVLPEDNTQVLPITQRQPTGIVLLRSPDTGLGSASVFVTTALETDGLSRVESIRGTALQVPPDTPHLVTGKDLSTPLGIELLQYIDAGNNALVFNQTSYANGTGVELEGAGVGIIDEAHPLALGDISWFGTRFYDLPDLTLQEGDRVLLQSADGRTILLERPTNRGRLLILNDPLDGLASNLPLQPAFVALMQSLIKYFDASTSVPSQVVLGQRMALPANVQLIDSSGNALLDIADSARASSIELEEPGIYTVVSSRGEQKLRAVLDASEADIGPLPEDALSAWKARYSRINRTDDGSETVATPAPGIDPPSLLSGTDPMRQALWYWLLPLLTVLLFAEGWFANRRLDVRRDGS